MDFLENSVFHGNYTGAQDPFSFNMAMQFVHLQGVLSTSLTCQSLYSKALKAAKARRFAALRCGGLPSWKVTSLASQSALLMMIFLSHRWDIMLVPWEGSVKRFTTHVDIILWEIFNFCPIFVVWNCRIDTFGSLAWSEQTSDKKHVSPFKYKFPVGYPLKF